MRLHGALGDEQARRDLGVRPALHDEVEDLGLPPRDTPVRVVVVAARSNRGPAPPRGTPTADRGPEAPAARRRPAPIPPATPRTRSPRSPRSPPPLHPERPHAAGSPVSPLDRSSRHHARPPRPCAPPPVCGSPLRPATPRRAPRPAAGARRATHRSPAGTPRTSSRSHHAAFNTVPPSASTAAVSSSSWRASAFAISSGARSRSSVEPTTSVSTNETTPVGNAPTDPA